MKTSQENFLCSYLYLKLAKTCISFVFFLLQNWRRGGQNRSYWAGQRWGLAPVEGGGGRERAQEDEYSENNL
jgi:hypothetical protein